MCVYSWLNEIKIRLAEHQFNIKVTSLLERKKKKQAKHVLYIYNIERLILIHSLALDNIFYKTYKL